MADAGLELLKLVGRRSELLAALVDGPREKRELEETLSESRSTVDRALKELEEAGLVTWTDGGYRATLGGRLQLQIYREFLDRSTDLLDAIEFIAELPPDAPIGPGLLHGCSVEGPDRLERYQVWPTATDMLARGERIVAAYSPTVNPSTIRRYVETTNDRGIPTETFLAPELAATLEQQFPDLLGGLAAGDGRVFEAPVARFGMIFLPEEGEVTVGASAMDGRPLGAVYNDTPEAAAWAEGYVEQVRGQATEVTEGARRVARLAGDRERLATQGFVDLESIEPHQGGPAMTGWRTGLELAEVGAGLALERERPTPDGRRSVPEEVTGHLRDGADVAVLGPPGSGKSTVCKTVAWRWHDDGRGPVLYRESGAGAPFESWPLLAELLRDADGHALVVVEDAVRADANDVFRIVAEFTDREDVTVLLDAREHEWEDPPSFPADGRLEAYRVDEMETIPMPPLDVEEVRRFVERFETETDATLAIEPEQLLAGIRETAEGSAAPAALQLLLHRLALRAEPLVADEYRTPTTLVEDVRRVVTAVQPGGEVALEVASLANLLNAAGLVVHPAYLHAIGAARDDHGGVRDAINQLEGRVLFPQDDGYRTVHGSWSALFLETLRSELGEETATERVGAAVTALLSLADDRERREAVASRGGVDPAENGPAVEAPGVDRIGENPGEWVVETIERLFGAAREFPRLAPLFDVTGGDALTLPEALPPEARADVVLWRGKAYLEGGYLDRAEREFDRLLDRTDRLVPERADAVRQEALANLGTVTFRRGNTDEAEARYRDALAAAERLGDGELIATSRKHLGNVSFVRGDTDAAEDQYRSALAAYRDLDDRLGVAYVRHNLGNVAGNRGDRDAAEDHYRAALAIYRDLGNRRDEADCLNNIGVIAEARGDLPAATSHYRECLERYRSLGDRIGQANALANLALVAEKRTDIDTAETYASRALDRYREVGDTQGEAFALRIQAGASRQRGRTDEAGDRLDGSHERCEEVGDQPGKAATKLRRARLERDGGDLDAATAAAQRAAELATETSGEGSVASAKVVLGDVARRRGDLALAGELFEDAERTYRDADAPLEAAIALVGRAEVALRRGDTESAVEALREAGMTVAGEIDSAADPGTLLVEACEHTGHLEALQGDPIATLREGDGSIDDRLDDLEQTVRRRPRSEA